MALFFFSASAESVGLLAHVHMCGKVLRWVCLWVGARLSQSAACLYMFTAQNKYLSITLWNIWSLQYRQFRLRYLTSFYDVSVLLKVPSEHEGNYRLRL